jgi:effector-binding domain-containing protein
MISGGVVEMFEPQVKEAQAVTVAYRVMHGSFAQVPKGYEALYGWVGRNGLQPAGMPQAIYLTAPGETPEEELVWELWAPVAGGFADAEPDEQGVGVKRVPAQSVASVMYKGPYDGIGLTYERLFGWIGQQGYRVAGPPRELYYSDPAEIPPEEYLTEVQIPVEIIV